jgi:hypothetical protein
MDWMVEQQHEDCDETQEVENEKNFETGQQHEDPSETEEIEKEKEEKKRQG